MPNFSVIRRSTGSYLGSRMQFCTYSGSHVLDFDHYHCRGCRLCIRHIFLFDLSSTEVIAGREAQLLKGESTLSTQLFFAPLQDGPTSIK